MEQNGGEDQFTYQAGAQPAVGATPAQSTTSQPPASPQIEPTEDLTTDTQLEQNTQEQSPLVQWNASEFIDHQKSFSWFIPLFVGVLLVAGSVYLITKDVLSTVVIVLAGLAFGVFARQKPRTLTYTLLPTTIKIGAKTYSYDDFKTFSIIQDGALFSVLLEPIKRFMPPLSIYFPPEDGERIFDTLAGHIPHQERQPDPVDRLMRKIRF